MWWLCPPDVPQGEGDVVALSPAVLGVKGDVVALSQVAVPPAHPHSA